MGVPRVPNEPEWIITTVENPEAHTVQFRELKKQQDDIQSAMMLWDYSSYYVNIPDRYFIIQGGRKIQPTGLLQFEDVRLCYARRVQQDVTMNTMEKLGAQRTTYLLGFEGILQGEKREIILEIMPDGKLWRWRNGR